MRAILTTFKGCTNTLPTRIYAKSGHQQTYISRDLFDTVEEAHIAAANKLGEKCGWGTHFVSGSLSADKMVHVYLDNNSVIVHKLEYELLKAK